jgi:hypothetical protein
MITYENFLSIIIEKFPFLKNFYREEEAEIGLYAIMGNFTINFIKLICESEENSELLRDIFLFFEDMATSNDEYIKDLLMYSTLEMIGDDKNILKTAKSYMGNETLFLSNKIEDFLLRSEDTRQVREFLEKKFKKKR